LYAVSFVFFLISSVDAKAVDYTDSTAKKSTILLKDKHQNIAPAEYFTKDTLFTKPLNNYGHEKPGDPGRRHSQVQDTNYFRAMRLNIPVSVRLSNDFMLFMQARNLVRELERGLPSQIALQNLSMSPEIFAPRPQELLHRQEMINIYANSPASRYFH